MASTFDPIQTYSNWSFIGTHLDSLGLDAVDSPNRNPGLRLQ